MTVLSAARTLGRESGWSLTNLEMQKVLYVAQMVHLEATRQPLFDEGFEAWDYGPVVPELYHALKHHGRRPVADDFHIAFLPAASEEERSVVAAYYQSRRFTAGQLINFTHRAGGAWEAAYRIGERNCPITNDMILREADHTVRASDDAVAWAQTMAASFETAPARYLDSADERAFRERLLG